MLLTHQRGAIFWAQTQKDDTVAGSVQNGARPVLIVSNDTNNLHSTVVTVVAITSQDKPNIPTHIQIPAVSGDGFNTILCEQIKTLPKNILKRYQGCLTEDVMRRVDNALALQLGLKKILTTPKDTIKQQPEINETSENKSAIRYRTEFKK